MVEPAGIAQIVSSTIPPPERSGYGSAIDALAPFAELKVHGALVGRGALEARRVVRITPGAHHYGCILGIELRRQLGMSGAEAIRGPSILGRRCASKVGGHMVVLPVGGHVDRGVHGLLVMIAGHTDSHSGTGRTPGGQIRVRRHGAAVVHLGSDGG